MVGTLIKTNFITINVKIVFYGLYRDALQQFFPHKTDIQSPMPISFFYLIFFSKSSSFLSDSIDIQ